MGGHYDADPDLAAKLADAERDAAVSRAVATISGLGRQSCIDCGHAIEPARRAAAPWAVRCIPCQQAFERAEMRRREMIYRAEGFL